MSSSKSLFLKIILKNILSVGNNTRIVDSYDLPDIPDCMFNSTDIIGTNLYNYEEFTSTQ